jgi:hypothetical protein
VPSSAVALLSAFGAAAGFGVGTVLQCVGARRVAEQTTIGFRLLHGLVRQPIFLGGFALDVLGFLLVAVAVRALPLFLVQAISSASIGVTAVLASKYLRESLRSIDRLGLGGIVLGLTLLTLSAAPGETPGLSRATEIVLLAVLPTIAVAARLLDRWRAAPPALLGALAGLAFGSGSIVARGIGRTGDTPVLADPLLWAAVAFAALGLLLFSRGLQRGWAVAVSAPTMAAETLVPAAVGVAFLGDHARPGLTWLALLGLTLTLGAALALTVRRPGAVALASPV